MIDFTFPKRTKREEVLFKHHYTEKVYRDENGKVTHFIIPEYDNPYDYIAGINEGVSGPAHFDGSIVKEDSESYKQFFQRLGWVDENGNIL